MQLPRLHTTERNTVTTGTLCLFVRLDSGRITCGRNDLLTVRFAWHKSNSLPVLLLFISPIK